MPIQTREMLTEMHYDLCDNCIDIANADQADMDGDGNVQTFVMPVQGRNSMKSGMGSIMTVMG